MSLLVLSGLVFMLAACSLHLSSRYMSDKQLSNIVEIALVVLFLAVAIVGFFALKQEAFRGEPQIAQQRDQTDLVVSGYTDEQLNQCSRLSSLLGVEQLNFGLGRCPDDDCTNQGLLVGVQTSNG